jgi:CTP:phosphocholine cytidylyltransferase-like protein
VVLGNGLIDVIFCHKETAYRIIASSNARLDAENLFIADSNSKAYVIGVLNEENNGVSVIQTSGIVQVEVDASNGSIMAGDFVTTSNLGKAIKSLSSEWVIGVAVSNEINGLVEVRIDIRFKQ